MLRAISFLFSLPVVAVVLRDTNFSGDLGLVETLLGIIAIISFAIIAAGWTVNHDS